MTSKAIEEENLEYLLDPKITFVNPQEISDFDHFRRKKRETLSLFQRPIATSKKFGEAIVAAGLFAFRYLSTHYLVVYVIGPLLAVWVALDWNPGPHTETLNNIEFWIEYTVWWVGLGILSSIGLGSGLQSGLLFLLPHIVKTCLTAQSCNSLDFDSVSDIWFRSPKSLFKCPATSELGGITEAVTLMGMWKKIIFVCFLQATGTAIGEIPPYWITRGARLAAIEAGTDNNEVPEELEQSNGSSQFINQAKIWMVWFLKEYGFFGVLVMASYPNIAFDLCGICCGHFLMPFWSFFIATFLGKAIIRNSYQSIIYVMMCSEVYMERMIQALQYVLPDALQLDDVVRKAFEEGKQNFHNLSQPSNAANSSAAQTTDTFSFKEVFAFWWQIFMFMLLSTFFLSCISHFAQYYEMLLDQEDSNILRKKLPTNVRNEILSPCSGRLRLPPPTPVTKKKAAALRPIVEIVEEDESEPLKEVNVVEFDNDTVEEDSEHNIATTLFSIAESSFRSDISSHKSDESKEGTEGEDCSVSSDGDIGEISAIEEDNSEEVEIQWDEDDDVVSHSDLMIAS